MQKLPGKQTRFGAVKKAVALAIVLILLGGGVLLYQHNQQENGYRKVISDFVTAMGKGDASKVTSLESTRFRNWIHNNTVSQNRTPGARQVAVTDSYYTLLKEEGMTITFSPSAFTGDKIETGGYESGLYVAPRGTTGKSETYIARYGQNSEPVLTISVVREGNTWVVDNITSYIYNTPDKS